MRIFSKALIPFAAAFFGKKLEYHPREMMNSAEPNGSQIGPREVSKKLEAQLAALNFKDEVEAKYHLDEIKASYAEVKAATEYQDQKTARLLTIMAFLTAAAGAIFTKVIDIYPLNFTENAYFRNSVIFLIYGLFGFYLLLIAAGALISFYAMQTRFVFDEKSVIVPGKPSSLLFFKFISITSPEDWAKEFTSSTPLQLLTTYVKNYIHETYLISIKTSDKVRRIQPAQDVLQLAIKVLILWIFALIISAGFVPRNTPQQLTDATSDGRISQAAEGNFAPLSPLSNAEKIATNNNPSVWTTRTPAIDGPVGALQTIRQDPTSKKSNLEKE